MSSSPETNKTLSIIMPTYDEEGNLSNTVEPLVELLNNLSITHELLIINDGSTDKSGEIADGLSEKYPSVEVFHHEKNKGYGGAQLTGFKNAKGKYIMLIPSDNQFHLDDLPQYLEEIKNADIVIGYRKNRADPKRRGVVAKIYNFSLRFLFGLKIRDIDWVKIYKKEFIDSTEIESKSALIDTELVIKAHKKGLKIKEVPCGHLPRIHGVQSGNNIKVLMRELKEFIKFWFKTL